MNVNTGSNQLVRVAGAPLKSGYIFEDDFFEGGFTAGGAAIGKFSQTADAGAWLTTVTQAGAGNATITIADDEPGGWLYILNDAADNDAVEMQLNGEHFKLQPGKVIVWELVLKVTDVSETDWFVGLAITDTTVLAGCTDFVGFCSGATSGAIDSEPSIWFTAGKNATTSFSSSTGGVTRFDTNVDTSDATEFRLQFVYDGSGNGTSGNGKLLAYVDGVYVGAITTNIPDDETLTPTICVRNDGAVAQSMKCHRITVKAE